MSDVALQKKDNLPLLSLGKYGKEASDKGSLRHKGNLRSCYGVEADYDAGGMTPREAAGRLAEAGIAALIYTSPSHGLPGKGQRWRLICPFSTPLAPEDRAGHVAAIDEVLGGVLARESYTLSQCYYFGGVGGREPEIFLVDGDHIDKRLVSPDQTAPGDPAPLPGRSDEIDTLGLQEGSKVRPIRADHAARGPATDESEDPDAVAHARERLAQAAERLERVESGENRNAGLNSEAFAMGGFVACRTLTADEVVEALGRAAETNGYTNDHGGEAEAGRIIRAGLKAGAQKPRRFRRYGDILDDLPPVDKDEDRGAVGEYTPDQDGALRAFTDRHRDRLRFDHDRRAWMEFDGATWRAEKTGLAHELARDECVALAAQAGKGGHGLRSNSAWEAVERAARRVRAFAVRSIDWDADPLILGTPGGVVDLNTGQWRAGRPEDMISKRTAVDPAPLERFDPDLDCPQWLDFLNFALRGDDATIRFLRQWAGVSLTGLTREEKLLFIHGGGGNGKSVAVNTLAWVAGDFAADLPASTLTATRHESHPTELARLQGARLAHASEVERGARWAETRIKSLVGGDPITARFMRGDHFTFTPQLTLTVVGNDRPSFDAVDDAIRRRFLLLEMDRKPDKPDPALPERLRAEGPGILSWMIEGALDWQRHGLVIPDAVSRATEEYMLEEDHFRRFVSECGERDPEGRAATVDLADAYASWKLDESDAPDLSSRGVAQGMQRLGFEKVEKVTRSDGKRGAGFAGFRLVRSAD